MRIFLINIKGAGVDLTAGKLTKDQVKNWDKIQANPELIDDNNPIFELYGTLVETATIEVIDDEGEIVDVYEYNDLLSEEVGNMNLKSGSHYVKETYLKGLFHSFELFLDNSERFDIDLIKLKTKEYKGEQYICAMDYDGDLLESIESITTGHEKNIQKIIC